MTKDRDDKPGDTIAVPDEHFKVQIDKDFFEAPSHA